MVASLLQILLIFGVPAALLWSEKRVRLVAFLSPVVLCYGLGIAFTNLFPGAIDPKLTNSIAEAVVVIAIPLLLFPSDLRGFWKLAPATATSFGVAIVSVCLVSVAGVYLFGESIEDSWMVSAMMVGVYTGGTPNMTAIAMSLEVPEETFILVNAADLLLGSLYLCFLMTAAQQVLSRFYRPFEPQSDAAAHAHVDGEAIRSHPLNVVKATLLSGLIVGSAVGLSILVTGGQSAPVIILSLTSLAIVASFRPEVRALAGSYEFGQYLMLVFCFGIGAMANLADLVTAVSSVLGYCTFVLVGSLVLHFIAARVLDIDVDTLIITSTAAVFGPPFIGPIANVLNNREIVVGGMTAGVIGLAIGNYLGYGIGMFLQP